MLLYQPKAAIQTTLAGGNFPDKLLHAHHQMAARLSRAPGEGEPHIMSFNVPPGGDMSQSDLVVGVAIASSSETAIGLPGDPVLRVYVSEQVHKENVAEFVATAFGVEALSAGQVPFEVVHTGPIDALSHRMRMRPAPGGISCGHHRITAGTLGCLARGRLGPRSQQTFILSNNHVLADVNAGQAGDPILQPGNADGGRMPGDHIADLERFVTIDFLTPNYVDCATAVVHKITDVRREQFFINSGVPSYFACGTTPVPAVKGLAVGKSGRTTQLTSGRITAVGATIRVNMGGGRIAVFTDQIEVIGLTSQFSAGGDSGSLIWTWDEHRNPVGLLFAGGGASTFANPIHHVLEALDIDLI